jgi:hypothetical protein
MHITFKREIPTSKMPGIIHRNLVESVSAQRMVGGPWKFYTHLINGRPDQTLDFIFGIDIGKGMGASNSVISVGCIQLRKKIAEFASANFAPHDFALLAAGAAVWFGGSQRGNRPLMIWEANGDPGIEFGKVIVRELQYPNYYMDRNAVDKLGSVRPRKYGWHSSTEKKEELLSDYRRSLAHGTFINPSEEALNEMETYVYLPGGGIGPAFLLEESASARKTHGDRVIADALCDKGMKESRIAVANRVLREPEAPKNSFAGRFKDWQRKQKELRSKRTWDTRNFRG